MRSAALHTREKHAALSGQYSGIKTSLWNAASAKGAVQISRRRRGSQSTKHFWGHAAAPRKRQSAEVAAATRVSGWYPLLQSEGYSRFHTKARSIDWQASQGPGHQPKESGVNICHFGEWNKFSQFLASRVHTARDRQKKKKQMRKNGGVPKCYFSPINCRHMPQSNTVFCATHTHIQTHKCTISAFCDMSIGASLGGMRNFVFTNVQSQGCNCPWHFNCLLPRDKPCHSQAT